MSSSNHDIDTTVTTPLLDAVTGLLDTTFTPLSDDAILDLVRDVEQATRMLAALGHQLIVEISDRGMPEHAGARTVKRFLQQTLRISHADAAARVAAARDLGRWHGFDGELNEPELPATAAAQTTGTISPDHARGIARIIKRIPGAVGNADREAAEHILADFATTGSPDDIPKIGEHILAHLDPDGTLTSERHRQHMRAITLGRARADGMSPISGEITPELRALLDPILAKLARPGMCNPTDPHSPNIADAQGHIDRDRLTAAAERDTRSHAQRNHDALLALLTPATSADQLGYHRGLPVSTILTMSITELENDTGVATTATGGTVPLAEALKLAENSRPYLAIFDHAGLPLHLGTTKRLASSEQRMALIAAVRGCTRPGCDAPASLCAAHHITDAAKNGPTNIDNLTLACDHCHSLIHDGPGGWKTITPGKDSKYPGRTAWIAPPHIDPTQTPQINHRHHPDELLAEALTRIHQRKELERHHHRQRLQTQNQHQRPRPAA